MDLDFGLNLAVLDYGGCLGPYVDSRQLRA